MPKGLETELFQNGCLAFKSPVSSKLASKAQELNDVWNIPGVAW
jgi:hypothetical protein